MLQAGALQADDDTQALLARAIPAIPRLRGRADLEVTPLESYTNRTFRIDTAGESLVLRIPGPGTNVITDRRLELQNLRMAVAWGLAPTIVWADAKSGLLLTRFVDNARTLTAADLDDGATRTAMLSLLARLHAAPPRLSTRLDPIATSRRYLAVTRATPSLTDIVRRLDRQLDTLDARLAAQPARVAPCHVDSNPGNFVSDGHRLWLVDYEYAAQCHPLWDLVCLAAEAGWTREALPRLVADWPGRNGTEDDAQLDAWWQAFELTRLAWMAAQVAVGNRVEESLGELEAGLAGQSSV